MPVRISELRLEKQRDGTYSSDVILQYHGDGFCMFCVLLGDDSQIADLETVVGSQVFQGVFVIFGDFISNGVRHRGGVN